MSGSAASSVKARPRSTFFPVGLLWYLWLHLGEQRSPPCMFFSLSSGFPTGASSWRAFSRPSPGRAFPPRSRIRLAPRRVPGRGEQRSSIVEERITSFRSPSGVGVPRRGGVGATRGLQSRSAATIASDDTSPSVRPVASRHRPHIVELRLAPPAPVRQLRHLHAHRVAQHLHRARSARDSARRSHHVRRTPSVVVCSNSTASSRCASALRPAPRAASHAALSSSGSPST